MPQRKWTKYKAFTKKGDWQIHTNYTDGHSTPDEYLTMASDHGLEFVLFSEHVRRNLEYDYLKFKEEVYRAGSKSNVRFAVGAEAKVLDREGNLDISDDIVSEADVVLFAFHSHNFQTKEEYMTAVKNAASNPIADIWAHPTSYHNEMGFFMVTQDWNTILNCLEKESICYELNKKYPPLSDTELIALRMNNGLSFTFGSDAHVASDLLTLKEIERFSRLIRN